MSGRGDTVAKLTLSTALAERTVEVSGDDGYRS